MSNGGSICRNIRVLTPSGSHDASDVQVIVNFGRIVGAPFCRLTACRIGIVIWLALLLDIGEFLPIYGNLKLTFLNRVLFF